MTESPHTVYRYFDHANRTLYIGITSQATGRHHQHRTSEWWYLHAGNVPIEHCTGRDAALSMERDLIKVYRPPFNKVHNENWEPIKAAYLALVAAEEALEKAKAGEAPGRGFCGHCEPCRAEVDDPDGDPTMCELASEVTCGHCGRADCMHRVGHYEGSMIGYEAGCAWGEDIGHRTAIRENGSAIAGWTFLSGVVDGWPREDIHVSERNLDRDAALSRISAALESGDLDRIIKEDTEVPF